MCCPNLEGVRPKGMKTQTAATFEESQPLSNPEPAADWGPNSLRLRNERNRKHQGAQAAQRTAWIDRNRYYYRSLAGLLAHLVEPGKRSLCINCETAFLLDAVKPAYGVGVDISEEMVDAARQIHPQFQLPAGLPGRL